jgi:hypothetical protein
MREETFCSFYSANIYDQYINESGDLANTRAFQLLFNAGHEKESLFSFSGFRTIVGKSDG